MFRILYNLKKNSVLYCTWLIYIPGTFYAQRSAGSLFIYLRCNSPDDGVQKPDVLHNNQFKYLLSLINLSAAIQPKTTVVIINFWWNIFIKDVLKNLAVKLDLKHNRNWKTFMFVLTSKITCWLFYLTPSNRTRENFHSEIFRIFKYLKS